MELQCSRTSPSDPAHPRRNMRPRPRRIGPRATSARAAMTPAVRTFRIPTTPIALREALQDGGDCRPEDDHEDRREDEEHHWEEHLDRRLMRELLGALTPADAHLFGLGQ